MIEQSRPIYIPDKMGQKLCKTGRAIERLTANLGRHPTTAEVAADLDIDSYQLHELIRVAAVPVSLDGPAAIGGDTSDGKLLDLIASPAGNPDTEEQLELERRLKILPPVVASIIRDYHGVGTLRVPMKKLAEKHKITIPRIKKIIDDAEVRLRNCLSQDALCSD